MRVLNQVYVEFPCHSRNESFARSLVSSFVSQLDPTIEEVEDIKTAVSEVVTNAIIHGYENQEDNEKSLISLRCTLYSDGFEVICSDYGKGIENVKKAREPLYTSKPHLERSGMGFTIMENFMDCVEVTSEMGKGTCVKMYKKISEAQGISESIQLEWFDFGVRNKNNEPV
jgi:stage II sporulation protein AB (anti-sigma F factor)